MGKKSNLIQGLIDNELKLKFDSMLEDRNFKVSKVIEAMTRLWLSLPADIQAKLYSKTVSESDFIELVREIVIGELKKTNGK
jgi:protein tyrosine/serine phosphatase